LPNKISSFGYKFVILFS